jgi:hypothetical protein
VINTIRPNINQADRDHLEDLGLLLIDDRTSDDRTRLDVAEPLQS